MADSVNRRRQVNKRKNNVERREKGRKSREKGKVLPNKILSLLLFPLPFSLNF
jgi:hypothetical protein